MSSNALWPDAHAQVLRALWLGGLSASQCAKKLNEPQIGGRYTRNAVIAKVHRLGLAGRATPSRPAKRPARPEKAIALPAKRSAPAIVKDERPSSRKPPAPSATSIRAKCSARGRRGLTDCVAARRRTDRGAQTAHALSSIPKLGAQKRGGWHEGPRSDRRAFSVRWRGGSAPVLSSGHAHIRLLGHHVLAGFRAAPFQRRMAG